LAPQLWRSKRASISPHFAPSKELSRDDRSSKWPRAKLSFVGKKGAPRDIAMKLNAALGPPHRHMA
jgi:hypothetical protein